MKIYHGTSAIYLDSILRGGLKPRGEGNHHWCKYPSRPDMVYLTTAYPFFFAFSTDREDSGKKLVVEIETNRLDPKQLFPDEDCVVQMLAANERKPIEQLHDEVRDNLEHYWETKSDGRQVLFWELSVGLIGTCCHKGMIPPTAFTRYCVFEEDQRAALAAICYNEGPHLGGAVEDNRKLTQWMFGDRKKLPRIIPQGFIANLSSDAWQLREYLKHPNWKLEETSRLGVEVFNI